MRPRRLATAAALGAALLLGAGCPASDGPGDDPYAGALVLRADPTRARVGDAVRLELEIAPERANEASALFERADDADLTRWHAEPADAVEFDAAAGEARFRAAGEVTLWATWETPSGEALRSNEVVVRVE